MQVQSWIALLEGDALKRCRRDRRSDAAFWAVPRILIAVRAMLDSEAGKRPLARRARRCFAAAVERGGGKGTLVVHCLREGKEKEKRKDEKVKEVKREGLEVIQENGKSGVYVAPSVVPSESASEFDFGFGDVSEDESHSQDEDEIEDDEESIIDCGIVPEEMEEIHVPEEEGTQETESEDEHYESGYDSEPDIRVQQDSPQIYLPELDVNITGMEGLTFNDFSR